MRIYLSAFLIFFLTQVAVASPGSLTFQGRILKSDGTPLEYNNVSFLFQILDPAGTCLIYQEQVTGYNMVNSGGVFDVPIGTGSVQYPAGGTTSVLSVFNNSETFTCGSCTLSGGVYTCTDATGTYAAASDDGRKLRVAFYDGSGWKTISPDNVIRSVPFAGYALSAQKLGDKTASDFLAKAGLPVCSAGTFLSWDGTALSCQAVSGASGGTVTNVTSSNAYLTVANGASVPSLTLNVGQAANTVAAGNDARIVNALQSGATAGGDLSGTLPSPTVVKIQGISVSSATPTAGNFMKYTSGAWTGSAISTADVTGLDTALSGTIKASQISGSCAVNQTLVFLSPSSSWTCTDISLNDSQITYASQSANKFLASPASGSGAPTFRGITAADLPASVISGAGTTGYVPYYSSSTTMAASPIYTSGGNVGIGTTSPVSALTVIGSSRVESSVDQGIPGLQYLSSTYPLPETAGAATTLLSLNNTLAGGTDNNRLLVQSIRRDVSGSYTNDWNYSGYRFASAINSSTTGAHVWMDLFHGVLTTDNKVAFGTGATEWLRFQNGNVGIGTTSPVSLLNIANGAFTLSGTGAALTSSADPFMYRNGGNFYLVGRNDGGSGGDLNFQAGSPSLTAMTVSHNGFVGIGTTNPVYPLTVSSSSPSTTIGSSLNIGPAFVADTSSNYISSFSTLTDNSAFNHGGTFYGAVNRIIANSSSSGTLGSAVGVQADVINQGAKNITSTAAGVSASTNNQGSGTITNAYGMNAVITNTGTGVITNGYGVKVSAPTNTGTGSIGTYYGLYLSTPTVATTNYALYAQGGTSYFGGLVGVGTTTPRTKLDVTGAVKITGLVGAETTLASAVLPYQGTYVAWNEDVGVGRTNFMNHPGTGVGGFEFSLFNSSGTYVSSPLLISSVGNVGIGTMSPSEKLDVTGNIKASGTITAPTVTQTSDIRFKKDIEPVADALNKILNLRGVTYDWRRAEFPERQFTDKHQMGVIAQEVEKQFPEAVVTGQDGYKSVNYSSLVAPLINAVKELYAKFVAQDRQLANQARDIASIKDGKADRAEVDAKVQRLEKENAELKAYLCLQNPQAPFCRK